MADVFSKKKRSQVMSRIRSRGNAATELALARLLRKNGITGWRKHIQIVTASLNTSSGLRPPSPHPMRRRNRGEGVKVRPDFVFRKERLAVFVDGCFWHGCPRHATRPRGNAAFWREKFARNKDRDKLVNRALRRAGWRVIRIWECALRRGSIKLVLRRIRRTLAG
jgi:DNA mismatch endonuclease (patch repair protein)